MLANKLLNSFDFSLDNERQTLELLKVSIHGCRQEEVILGRLFLLVCCEGYYSFALCVNSAFVTSRVM